MVGLLLEADADPVARNAAGETPWDLLQKNPGLGSVEGSHDYHLLNGARFSDRP